MKKVIQGIILLSCSLSALASDYKQIGTFLLEYSIFKIDVYQITYLKSDESEKLVLDYKMPVKKKYSLEGWKVGLEHKLKDDKYIEKAQWLFDHTVDMEKGDVLSIVRKGPVVEISKNDKVVGSISDPQIAELAFEPWLGEKPVDNKLKAALLGDAK